MKQKTDSAAESAAKFFESFLYLKINNNGIRFKDVQKVYSFLIIANNPGLSMAQLERAQLKSGDTVRDLEYHHFQKGLMELQELALIRIDDGRISITEEGGRLYVFMHDRKRFEGWLSGIRYPEGTSEAQKAYNIEKVRHLLDCESVILRKYAVKPEIADAARE